MLKQTYEEIMQDYRILMGIDSVVDPYERAVRYEAALREPHAQFEQNVRILELARRLEE